LPNWLLFSIIATPSIPIDEAAKGKVMAFLLEFAGFIASPLKFWLMPGGAVDGLSVFSKGDMVAPLIYIRCSDRWRFVRIVF
jgi:hypothetical protein